MDGGEEKDAGGDLYAVLGLNKECTDGELRVAYKNLARRWHPDRCSASGTSNNLDEAKEKFQEIQGAYSVLSNSNKRFLYDIGAYDSDNDSDAMCQFLGEMAQMMCQGQPTGAPETLEDLQELFVEIFQTEVDAGFGNNPSYLFSGNAVSSTSHSPLHHAPDCSTHAVNGTSKRGVADLSSGPSLMYGFDNVGGKLDSELLPDTIQSAAGGSQKRRNTASITPAA